MQDLDHKDGWALKNCCFWTVVIEKTLESPSDGNEIKPVNPKGDQPWMLIGGCASWWMHITDSMYMSLSKFQEIVKDRVAWHAAAHWSQWVEHDWATEQQCSLEWLMLKLKFKYFGHLTHWKRPWCWTRMKAGGKGDDRRQVGWIASPTQLTLIWSSCRGWWRKGKPGLL